MGCNNDGLAEYYFDLKLKAEIDKLTRLLCYTCELLLGGSTVVSDVKPAELTEWWTRHRETDEQRVRREALAKLTPDERKALGL